MLKKLFGIRDEISPLTSAMLSISFLLLIVVLWFFLTRGDGTTIESRIIHPMLLPSPSEMIDALPGLLSPQKKLFESITISLKRITQGFLIALLFSLPLGILMGTFGRLYRFFSPLILLGSYLPIPALLPLTIAILGTEEEQKIGFLAIASFVFLLPAFVNAINNVDDVFLNTGYTLGSNKLQLIVKIIMPTAMPEIFDSMRAGFGVGFTWIIMAEIIGADSGLGYLLRQAQSRGGMDSSSTVYLILTVIIFLAFVIDWLWRIVYKQLFPYKEKK